MRYQISQYFKIHSIMSITKNSNIGKLVAENYRYATVFKTAGIDFCCNGNRTIEDACAKGKIDADELINDLNNAAAQGSSGGEIDYRTWPLDLLADYIEKTHHRYVETKIVEITPYLNKVMRVHGDNHPELLEIGELFFQSAKDLSAHLVKEEGILFPHIRNMVAAQIKNAPLPETSFGDVKNPIEVMFMEHDNEGERFRKIAALSDNYTPPADACGTYRVTFSLIEEFENDLHKHIHLENNILFPKAIELEKAFAEAN